MSLTLNMIEHELREFVSVHRREQRNLSFVDIRVYLDPSSIKDETILYITDSPDDVKTVVDLGLSALFVNPDCDEPDSNASLSVCGDMSLLSVFNRLLDIFRKYNGWERSMDELFLSGRDLQELVDISSSFLQNNLVIVDPALKLLAYTKDVPCDDPITEELIAHGYHTEENIRQFKLHKRFKPWAEQHGFIVNDTKEICRYTTVVKSFKTQDSYSLIIVMMCNKVQPEGWLLDTYEMFAQRVRRFAQRDYPADKPSGNAVDTFLHDLFSGRQSDSAAINERGRILNIPSEARFCLFYIDASSEDIPFRRLVSDVTRLVAPAKVVSIREEAIAVFCFNCQSEKCALHCQSGTCPLGNQSMSARLDMLMQRVDLVCGRSSKFKRLDQTRYAYLQAKEACYLGARKLSHRQRFDAQRNWSRIFSFDECCIDYLVERCGDENLAAKTYASYVLDRVSQQDTAAKTDNYEFLYEYLISERRASVVAEKLHMHRNNVKYRIDRIESQYGIDTADPSLRFDFLLAYRMREAGLVRNAQ